MTSYLLLTQSLIWGASLLSLRLHHLSSQSEKNVFQMGAMEYMVKPEIFTDYHAYMKTLYQKLEALC